MRPTSQLRLSVHQLRSAHGSTDADQRRLASYWRLSSGFFIGIRRRPLTMASSTLVQTLSSSDVRPTPASYWHQSIDEPIDSHSRGENGEPKLLLSQAAHTQLVSLPQPADWPIHRRFALRPDETMTPIFDFALFFTGGSPDNKRHRHEPSQAAQPGGAGGRHSTTAGGSDTNTLTRLLDCAETMPTCLSNVQRPPPNSTMAGVPAPCDSKLTDSAAGTATEHTVVRAPPATYTPLQAERWILGRSTGHPVVTSDRLQLALTRA